MPASSNRERCKSPCRWLWALLALVTVEMASDLASAPTFLAPMPSTSFRNDVSDTNCSEYLNILGAGRWHKLGFRGQGVKVAVLDSGFRGYRDFLGKGLPAHVHAK